MRPLFTIHAGEYLVAGHIEQNFKNVNVWIPARDSGVDLLVTDRANRKCKTLQVKFSRDFLIGRDGPAFRQELKAIGWWNINREKLLKSPADYWVFVLFGLAGKSTEFVVLKKNRLIRQLEAIHGRPRIYRIYIFVAAKERCWEARGLVRAEQEGVAKGSYRHPHRNFTRWLNNWSFLEALNR